MEKDLQVVAGPHKEPAPFPHRLPVTKTVQGLQQGSAEGESREVLTTCKHHYSLSHRRDGKFSLVHQVPFAGMVAIYRTGFEITPLGLNSNFTTCQLYDLGQVI